MELSYIELPVKDLEALRTWYVTRLNLSVISESRDHFTLAGPCGAAIEFRRGKPLENPERVKLAFRVDDLSSSLKRISDGKIQIGPKKTERGRIVAEVKDPAGHTVELFQVELVGIR